MQKDGNFPTLEEYPAVKPQTTHWALGAFHTVQKQFRFMFFFFFCGRKSLTFLGFTYSEKAFLQLPFQSDSSTLCVSQQRERDGTRMIIGALSMPERGMTCPDVTQGSEFWWHERISLGCQAPGFRVWINTASSWHTCVWSRHCHAVRPLYLLLHHTVE